MSHRLQESSVSAPSEFVVSERGGTRMRIAPWYLAALAPFAAIGYSGAHLAHAFVVLLVIGIFLGTLTMRRSSGNALPPVRD